MMNRQEFLKSIALAGAAAALFSEGASDVLAQGEAGRTPDLVAVMGGEPDTMFATAIKQMGGIGRFVKKGQKVCIKPNIGWDKTPELAANTNPLLVATLVKACLAAGASEVVVFDHTCDDWRRSYETSGIAEAVEKAGGKMMPGNEPQYYRLISFPRAKNMKTARVHQAILDSDVWINMPVLKTHSGAKMTICMKNLMGIVEDRRFFHTNDLHQCIADICTIDPPPVLNIVDAYRVLKSNGPRGRDANDVVKPQALFMSTDIVAIDTAASKFFNGIVPMPLENLTFLAHGEELGVGTMDLNSLKIKRVKL